ncbi:DNA-binding FadR family transcriptional regulator [Amycolatopsis bartoniae]|uniref:FadR/GntR family transcriptional regulator n=1 Tax=Amycolatopsis bartoniae TaxID=941986 RepID=UPI0016069C1D|nr:FCD domain-containing protein [Amycolatopsis bartoniae]MBB2939683.1 DNA-binding FadR family transcriptional regulator [Amycolatopsis bartoniae]
MPSRNAATVTTRESGPDDSKKLAERVAAAIEHKIADMGWPVGQWIGSEPELLAEFGVSRVVFRQAVSLLEHHSIAEMRRGPLGGLTVTAPDGVSVVRSAALNLRYNDATPQDVFEARVALELKCVELAAERIDEDGIAKLRASLASEAEHQRSDKPLGSHDIHRTIAELTGNPAMRLFIDVLTQLSVSDRPENLNQQQQRGRTVVHAHERIVDAIISGDVAVARHRMLAHLRAIAKFIDAGEKAHAKKKAAVAGPKRAPRAKAK